MVYDGMRATTRVDAASNDNVHGADDAAAVDAGRSDVYAATTTLPLMMMLSLPCKQETITPMMLMVRVPLTIGTLSPKLRLLQLRTLPLLLGLAQTQAQH